MQALSGVYVGRGERLARGADLDGAGKRAAFALYFAPLHWLTVREIVGPLGADAPGPGRVLELGCGTAASGAAWAAAIGPEVRLEGVDQSGWAVGEAPLTLRALGVRGRTRRGDLLPAAAQARPGDAVLAAWTVNELDDRGRDALLPRLLRAAERGARLLVLEPIARGIAPWWDAWSRAVEGAGGRADEWRLRVELPDLLARLDRAAGLDHRELTARTLYHQGRA